MLDLGMWEILMIAVVALLVVGPRELPGALRTVFRLIRKAKSMARDFQRDIEEVANDAGITEIKKDIEKIAKTDLKDELGDVLEGEDELREQLSYKDPGYLESAKKIAPSAVYSSDEKPVPGPSISAGAGQISENPPSEELVTGGQSAAGQPSADDMVQDTDNDAAEEPSGPGTRQETG